MLLTTCLKSRWAPPCYNRPARRSFGSARPKLTECAFVRLYGTHSWPRLNWCLGTCPRRTHTSRHNPSVIAWASETMWRPRVQHTRMQARQHTLAPVCHCFFVRALGLYALTICWAPGPVCPHCRLGIWLRLCFHACMRAYLLGGGGAAGVCLPVGLPRGQPHIFMCSPTRATCGCMHMSVRATLVPRVQSQMFGDTWRLIISTVFGPPFFWGQQASRPSSPLESHVMRVGPTLLNTQHCLKASTP